MTWDYSNPKTKIEAIHLMIGAKEVGTCESLEFNFEGKKHTASGDEIWGPDGSIEFDSWDYISKEIIDAIFSACKAWWNEQTESINKL